jgi:ubiquinone/menaquinone biosynthesis C-methylase UbiE
MRPDWDHNAYYHRLLLRHLPRPCGRVLDVGCGAGNFAAELARHAENVDALDRSPAMIEVARRVVLDPELTTRQVRRQAAALLPGAQVRRLVFWHYFLLWHKPARTA